MILLVLVVLGLLPTILQAQSPEGADSTLAQELRARVALDQAARDLMMVRSRSNQPMGREDVWLITTVDSLNTAWLKRHVETHGWPRQSDIGYEGAHDAWLLVQHADRDPAFQQLVVGLMETAVAAGEASGADFAYLTDRILVARGDPQLYGTQLRTASGGAVEPFPIEDPENVDKRRAVVGLPPLSEYLLQVKNFYGESP